MRSRNQYNIFICGSLFYFVLLQHNTVNKSISYQLVSDTSNCIQEQNTLSGGGEGASLSVDQILYRIFEALHLAQQPKGQLWQSEWADKERNHQQNRPFCGEYATSTATPSGTDLSRAGGNCRESVLWVRQMLQAACFSNSIIVYFHFYNQCLVAE